MSATHTFTREDLIERDIDRVVPVHLPTTAVNVLTQVRRTLNGIEDLSISIHKSGQMTRGVVVALTQRQTTDYLRELNSIHGSSHKRQDLVASEIDGEKYYLILVAGHRRFDAVCLLVKKKAKITKHYLGSYRAELHFGMSVRQALSIQFQENRHQQVPTHEEAASAWSFYCWQRRENPKLTLTQFGRSIGRSVSWVRNAVRFCTLPDSLQDLAAREDAPIPYGILIEAARLADGLHQLGKSMDESDLLSIVTHAVARKVTVAKFREEVSARLSHARNGQASLFGELPEQKKPTRSVVQPELAQFIWAAISWVRQVEVLREQGAFAGPSHWSPETNAAVLAQFSPGSPIRLTSELLTLLEQLLPHFEDIAAHEGGRHRADLKNGKAVVAEAGKLFDNLGEVEIHALESA